MLPLAPEELRSLSERYCVQSNLIAKLVRLLQLVRSLGTDELSEMETFALSSLRLELEERILLILYPALVEDGAMLLPDERSRLLRISGATRANTIHAPFCLLAET